MKSKAMRSIVLLGLLAILPLYGCGAMVAGGAAAGATYVYTKGWVERDYPVGLERAFDASVEAANGLGLNITEKTQKVANAKVKASKDDLDYWIKLTEKSPDLTVISVREGYWGNQEASKKVHEEIQKML